jgi:hypothetical protein
MAYFHLIFKVYFNFFALLSFVDAFSLKFFHFCLDAKVEQKIKAAEKKS